MRWIEAIGHEDGCQVVRLVDRSGNRSTGCLSSLRATLPPRGYEVASARDVSLASLEPVDALPYLTAFGVAHAQRGHQVYSIQAEGRLMHIPAAVLLHALLGTPSVVGPSLLRAGSLDQLVLPIAEDGAIKLELLNKPVPTSVMTDGLKARLAWLACFPSARRFWESVYLNGARGALALLAPLAKVDAKFFGRSMSGVVFVTRMAVRALTPDEVPFPFALTHTPRTFNFADERERSSATHLSDFRARTNVPEMKRQTDIPRGPLGWAMTGDEWEVVRQRMRKLGFSCHEATIDSINLALEKHGAGRTWGSLGITKGSWTRYSDWLRSGKWDALKTLLQEIRPAQPGTSS